MRHTKPHEITNMAISPEEREFFIQLGERIATLRKARDITQIQMAEILGVSQQTVNSYEVGRRRVPASALVTLSEALEVSLDELLGRAKSVSGKRGPTSKLQQQMERVSNLPRTKQKFVMQMLDAVIQQQAS